MQVSSVSRSKTNTLVPKSFVDEKVVQKIGCDQNYKIFLAVLCHDFNK